MTRIIRPKTLHVRKLWNSIPGKSNIDGWNQKKKLITNNLWYQLKKWGLKSK